MLLSLGLGLGFKQMKKLSITILGFMVINFMGCTNLDKEQEVKESSYKKIPVEVACSYPDTAIDYIDLKGGDQTFRYTEASGITVFHDENDVKKVCLNRI